MANNTDLKAAIAQVIKTNGNNEITGQILQNSLFSIINQLGGGATFVGIATPTTNPGTSDANVFYLASATGTYTNFDAITVAGEFTVLTNRSGSWAAIGTGVPTNAAIGSQWAIITAGDCNIDTVNHVFTAKGSQVIVQCNNKDYVQIRNADITVPIESSSFTGLIWLVFDRATSTFKFVRYTEAAQITKTMYFIAVGRYTSTGFSLSAMLSNIVKLNGEQLDGATLNTAIKNAMFLMGSKVSENQNPNADLSRWINSTNGVSRKAEQLTDLAGFNYLHGEFLQNAPATGDITFLDFFQILSRAWADSPTGGNTTDAFFQTGDVVTFEIVYRSNIPKGVLLCLNYSNRYPSVSLPSTGDKWVKTSLTMTIIEAADVSKSNMWIRLDNKSIGYTAGQYFDLKEVKYMNNRLPFSIAEKDDLTGSDTIKIDNYSINWINPKGNFAPAATANIPAADIFQMLTNAVYTNVQDENGLNWYRLGFTSGGENNNTGFLGKTVANLLALKSYVTSDINDNAGFHPGDKLYFKIRFKANKTGSIVLQYNNLATGGYLARATSDSITNNTEKDTTLYVEKKIKALPAGQTKVGLSLCFQVNAATTTADYIQFREVTISKTPFNATSIITSEFDDNFGTTPDVIKFREIIDGLQYAGNQSLQRPVTDINLLLTYGQSNGSGQQTAPPLSRDNFRGNLMLGDQEWVNNYGNTNPTTFNPLYALPAASFNMTTEECEQTKIDNQVLCESSGVGYANATKNVLDNFALGLFDRVFLAINSAIGGQSIELLSKNCPNNKGADYTKLLQAITSAKSVADTAGKTIGCNSVTWIQGEYNATQAAGQGWTAGTNATNDPAQYKAYLKQLITDLFADIKTVFEQSENPAFFLTQHGTSWLREFEMYIQMALLETANEDDRATMVCPLYQVTNRGHLDPNGQRWVGEYISKVYYRTILKGEKWKPLQPRKITKSGTNTLIIDFVVPCPPLMFNTWHARPITDYGFRLRLNGKTFVPISSVSITGSTQVTIVASSAINVGDIEIGYASYGYAYGNLCDSDEYKALTNYTELPSQLKPSFEPKDKSGNIIYNQPYPLNNYCVQFYYKIPQANNELIINV